MRWRACLRTPSTTTPCHQSTTTMSPKQPPTKTKVLELTAAFSQLMLHCFVMSQYDSACFQWGPPTNVTCCHRTRTTALRYECGTNRTYGCVVVVRAGCCCHWKMSDFASKRICWSALFSFPCWRRNTGNIQFVILIVKSSDFVCTYVLYSDSGHGLAENFNQCKMSRIITSLQYCVIIVYCVIKSLLLVLLPFLPFYLLVVLPCLFANLTNCSS